MPIYPGSIVIQAEQRYHSVDIRFVADEITNPSRFREDVMRFSLAGRDQLFADEQRKWQVCESVAVQMTQLPAPEPKLYPTKSVWSGRYARPRGHFTHDGLLDTFGHDLPRLPPQPWDGLVGKSPAVVFKPAHAARPEARTLPMTQRYFSRDVARRHCVSRV